MGGFCSGGFVQGDFVRGDFVLGGILSRGILSGGFCPGGFCPGGFCPRTPSGTKVRLKTPCTKFSNRCCFSTIYQIFIIQISF